jgi:hypothetical protein
MDSGSRVIMKECFRFELPRLTAASGLVLRNGRFYCVADDELSLLSFPRTQSGSFEVLPLIPGVLPEEPRERKRRKPDFEALVHLPESDDLLCLPSGSTSTRVLGARVDPGHQVRLLRFERSYESLRQLFPELNIEGAVVIDDRIRLFQRGNGKLRQNAIVDISLEAFLADRCESPVVREISLGGGEHGRVWGFTDAWRAGNVIWFLAAAESSESTYLDGEFLGARLGKMNLKGEVIEWTPLDIPEKPEGLVVDGDEIFVVTDADDRSRCSGFFAGHQVLRSPPGISPQ